MCGSQGWEAGDDPHPDSILRIGAWKIQDFEPTQITWELQNFKTLFRN